MNVMIQLNQLLDENKCLIFFFNERFHFGTSRNTRNWSTDQFKWNLILTYVFITRPHKYFLVYSKYVSSWKPVSPSSTRQIS